MSASPTSCSTAMKELTITEQEAAYAVARQRVVVCEGRCEVTAIKRKLGAANYDAAQAKADGSDANTLQLQHSNEVNRQKVNLQTAVCKLTDRIRSLTAESLAEVNKRNSELMSETPKQEGEVVQKELNPAQPSSAPMTLSQLRKWRPDWKSMNVDFDTFQQQAASGKYDLDPPHQREVVHDDAWKSAVLSSALIDGDIPATYWHPSEKDPNVRESLDGKQRCSAVLEYMNNGYRYRLNDVPGMRGKLYKELPRELQRELNGCSLNMQIASRTLTPAEIERFFGRRQDTKRTTCGEHLNSCVDSQLRTRLMPLCKSLKTEFTASRWTDDGRFGMLARAAQLAHVSVEDANKGSKGKVQLRAANKMYSVEPKDLKSWWSKAVLAESQLNDVERLIKAVVWSQNDNVIFKGGNGSKCNVMACAYYIQRFCWDCAAERIDEDALKQFAKRLTQLTLDQGRIELGTVDGDHNSQAQRERLVELVNQQ
jgi:hypothetical protein